MKIRKVVIKQFLQIVIFLSSIIILAIIKPIEGQLYFKEKAMMRTAFLINKICIFPLSKAFGNRNILTLPFYAIRDKFYYTAYDMYPEYEAEKEVQWYAIRYTEYKTLYSPMYEKYYKTNPQRLANDKNLWLWSDEIYNHAMLLSKDSTIQPFFNKFIFSNFVGFMFTYIEDRPLLFLAKDNYSYTNLLNNKKELERFNNILVTLVDLKRNFQKNNIESLNYFLNDNNVYCQEFLMKHEIIVYLLANKQMNEKFSCKDSLINQYIENRKQMIKYLDNPPIETVKTMNKESIYDYLYKWQLNNELQNSIETQCKTSP